MKKIDSVLDHFVAQPHYARLRQGECFRRIKAALPAPLQRGILFMYVKNRTLFFALKHPAFKMEFDYKLSLIKNLLTSLPPLREACQEHRIEKVRAFVSRFAPAPQPTSDTVPRYRERAHPDFPLRCEDEEVRRRFLQIQQTIAANTR